MIKQRTIDRLLAVWAFTLTALILSGCFSARKGADKAQEKVAEAQAAIATNRTQQLDRAATFIHGTQRALAAETNRTPAVGLAYDLNSRAATIIGPPRYEDAVAIETAVRGALSGVAEQQTKAAEILAKLDGQVAGLQKRMDSLQGRRAEAEEARDDKMTQYAAEADFGRNVKRWLWIGGLGIAGMFILPFALQVISIAMPALAPLTQIASSIVVLPFKFLVKAVPAAANAAGVVSREAHEKVETVAIQTASAIQALKDKDRAAYESKLKPLLLSATDEESQDTIRILKKSLKPVRT